MFMSYCLYKFLKLYQKQKKMSQYLLLTVNISITVTYLLIFCFAESALKSIGPLEDLVKV